MTEQLKLQNLLPAGWESSVRVEESLTEVVANLLTVLPADQVFFLFCSLPSETGGVAVFPYCQVDKGVIFARNWIDILERLKEQQADLTESEVRQKYDLACVHALRVLVWVRIGYGGVENWAASQNNGSWTGNHHQVAGDHNAIKLTGAKMFYRFLGKFVAYRDKHRITDDFFAEYGLEYLLDEIREVSRSG